MNPTNSELAAVEFKINPDPRCACVLLLDTSGSMQGDKLDGLHEGLAAFRDAVAKDSLAARRLEVAIVTFNSQVTVEHDFTTIDNFPACTLKAEGLTHMGSGIHAALDLVEARKAEYKANGIAAYCPWVILITDGEPQGEPDSVFDSAGQRVREAEGRKKLAFFPIGVEGADMSRLAQVAVRTPVKLKGLNFVELFLWLASSMGSVSRSRPDDAQVALPPPGWASV